MCGYINTNTSTESGAISRMYYESGSDGYIRKCTLDHLKSSLNITPQTTFPTQGTAADIGWVFAMTTGGWGNYRHATIASVRASMGIPGRILYSAGQPAAENGAIWLKPI